jgi:hypothetical protein
MNLHKHIGYYSKGYCNYLTMLYLKQVEKIRNRHKVSAARFKVHNCLLEWTGIEYIYARKNNKRLRNYYSKIKGDIQALKISQDGSIAYDDHLPRIRVKADKIITATFTRPKLSNVNYKTLNIKSLCAKDNTIIEKISSANQCLSEAPQAFDYREMESKNSNRPVCIDLPSELGSDYTFNKDNNLQDSFLHLPIKITKNKSDELIKQGRVLAHSDQAIQHDKIYIPESLAPLRPIINYIAGIELKYNPSFLDDYYIFITVSNSIVETNTMQRRGGWHIDGHQGHERMQRNGQKLNCDRQYLLCDTLPTEYVNHQFDFTEAYEYCKAQNCHIDSVNMQDVIEHEITKALDTGLASVQSMQSNKLFFLNPYMVHKAKLNSGPAVSRTFLRVLVSPFKRDRLGDTVNPVLGPLWRYKIKTITDIHEMERKDA